MGKLLPIASESKYFLEVLLADMKYFFSDSIIRFRADFFFWFLGISLVCIMLPHPAVAQKVPTSEASGITIRIGSLMGARSVKFEPQQSNPNVRPLLTIHAEGTISVAPTANVFQVNVLYPDRVEDSEDKVLLEKGGSLTRNLRTIPPSLPLLATQPTLASHLPFRLSLPMPSRKADEFKLLVLKAEILVEEEGVDVVVEIPKDVGDVVEREGLRLGSFRRTDTTISFQSNERVWLVLPENQPNDGIGLQATLRRATDGWSYQLTAKSPRHLPERLVVHRSTKTAKKLVAFEFKNVPVP